MTLAMPIAPEANELLSRDAFALLLAMMLDQQVPFEKAFGSPYELTLRLGHEPTAGEIAEFDPDALAAIFAERPALHRFPQGDGGAGPGARQDHRRPLRRRRQRRSGRTAADAAELRRGCRTAQASAPTRPRSRSRCSASSSASSLQGWREAAGHFGEEGSHYSVADIRDERRWSPSAPTRRRPSSGGTTPRRAEQLTKRMPAAPALRDVLRIDRGGLRPVLATKATAGVVLPLIAGVASRTSRRRARPRRSARSASATR